MDSLDTDTYKAQSPFSFLMSDRSGSLDSSEHLFGDNPTLQQNSLPPSTTAHEPYMGESSVPSLSSSTQEPEDSTMNDPINDVAPWEDESTNNLGKSKRRKRQPKNCSFCRRRKLKCDREHPCSNCVKRNLESNCTYVNEPEPGERRSSDSNSPLTDDKIPPRDSLQPKLSAQKARPQIKFCDFVEENQSQNPTQAGELKKRLDKMEMLVLSMLQEKNSAESNNTTPESGDDKGTSPRSLQLSDNSTFHLVNPQEAMDKARDSLGMLKLDSKGKSIYHGETHWGALFSEIEQLEDLICNLTIQQTNSLKNIKDRDVSHSEDGLLVAPLPFLSAGSSKMSPMDVLSNLPSQSVCDLLVNRYFEVFEPLFCVIHRPVFEKEYIEFWLNARSTELVWVSMLLGMLVLALQSYDEDELPAVFRGNRRKTWLTWLEGAEVCAAKGKVMMKPALNNVRAVILWIMTQANCNNKWDWVDNTAGAAAMVIRMAQSMGLHRDPKWFNVPPYEAEQRKRIWTLVNYFDLHGSMVQGLPTVINSKSTDVCPPSNYNDDEIMPEYDLLPKPSPLNVRTGMSYTICRARMAQWLSKVLEDSSATGPNATKISYEEVMEMHRNIRSTYMGAPAYLSTSVLDGDNSNTPVELLMQRVWYEIDYLRTLHALHRYYGALGMDNLKYRGSREESMAASIRLLNICEWCFTNPDGVKTTTKFCWVLNNFLISHFLHATVYVCLTLIDLYDTFSIDSQVEYIRLIDLALAMLKGTTNHTQRYMPMTVLLEALVGKVHSISKMSVKQRHDVNTARDRRAQAGYTYNSRFNPASAQAKSKGMTMPLDTTDSTVRFDKFGQSLPDSGLAPTFDNVDSPTTPGTWFSLADDSSKSGMQGIGFGPHPELDLGLSLDITQLEALYQMNQM